MPAAQANSRSSSPWRKSGLLPKPASASTQEKRTPASRTRSISASAISGLVCAVRAASGTPAASQRSASSVQTDGRNSRSPTGSGTSPRASVSETSTWQFATLPNSPQYCRATPTESSPFLGRPESSTTSTAPSPPTCLSTSSASTRHSGASSQAGLLMKWCNWSCPDKPSRSAIGWTLLRPPEPSSPRTYSGAILRRVLRPVASRKGSSQHFADLADPSQQAKLTYPLDEILLLCLLGGLAGAACFTEIALFGVKKRGFLRRFRPFKDSTPDHRHLGDILAVLDPEQFQRCFVAWMGAVSGVPGGVIAIDGKTVRRSAHTASGKAAIHMVSAFAAGQRLVLGQAKVAERSNEIIAIPKLLDMLAIEGAIVTIDAMGC